MKKQGLKILSIIIFLFVSFQTTEAQYNKDSLDKYEKLGNNYLKQNKLDKAIYNHNLAIGFATGDNRKLRDLCNWIASSYEKNFNYTFARKYYEKSLEYSKSFENSITLFNGFLNIGNQYYKEKDNAKALINYQTAILYSSDLNEYEKKVNQANINLCNTRIAEIENKIVPPPVGIPDVPVTPVNNDYTKYDILYDVFKDSLQFTKLINEEAFKAIDSMNKEVKYKRDSIAQLDSQITEKLSIISDKDKVIDEKQKTLIILGILLPIILVLGIFALNGYRIKRKQNNLLEVQKKEIEKQAKELKQTLENLQNTQKQLIQSEKMASLGQLIAGIAHELNTPLGAIKSSISSVNSSISKIIEELPDTISILSKPDYALFMRMLKESTAETNYYTSRELRQIKKDMKKELEQLNIENFDDVAENLVDIKIYKNFETYLPLIKHSQSKQIFQTAYNIVNQQTNGHNIEVAVEGASKIIFALKTYSYSDNKEEKVKTNINQNIENVLAIYHNQLKHGITLTKDLQAIPELMSFPNQLTQIWTNIIYNAIQAMSFSGSLHIVSKLVDKKIIISFKDSGKGIPDEIKDKIFEPFFTTKPQGEGTGLGLDIVRKIVHTHNGEIYFESTVGKGTTFFVEFNI